jgi:hypothetical protein
MFAFVAHFLAVKNVRPPRHYRGNHDCLHFGVQRFDFIFGAIISQKPKLCDFASNSGRCLTRDGSEAGGQFHLDSRRHKDINFCVFHNFGLLNFSGSIVVLAPGAITGAWMPLNATTGATSPSRAAHPLIGALANCRIATVSARATGVCFFWACARYDFTGFVGFFGGNHPCFFVAIPPRSNGFELFFYGVGVAGYCYQIFGRFHNFVCVILTSRFRRGDCHSLVTMDTIPDGLHFVNTLFTVLFI